MANDELRDSVQGAIQTPNRSRPGYGMGHLSLYTDAFPRSPSPPPPGCVSYGLMRPTVQGRIIDTTEYAIIDPPSLTEHWGIDTCVSAGHIDKRVLIFTRNLNFINARCCHHIQPMGYDDSYQLIEYLPVVNITTPARMSKKYKEIACMVPSRYNIGAFEHNLAALVVDVRIGRTIVSGHATELLSFTGNTLTFKLSTEESSGVSYDEFLLMLAGKPIDRHPAPTTEREILDDMMEGDGFVRIY